MEEREFNIKREDIRTMKKDIARFKGEQMSVSVSKKEPFYTPLEPELKEKLQKAEPLYDAKPRIKEKNVFLKSEKKEVFIPKPEVEKEREPENKDLPKLETKPVIKKEPEVIEKPEQARQDILKEKQELEKERNEINKKLEDLSYQKRPFDARKTTLFREVENIQKGFDSISRREKKIEHEIEVIEKQESSSQSAGARRSIEKRRWEAEEKRRVIEKERWPWEEKFKEAQDKIEKVEAESLIIDKKKKELEEKQREISDKLARVQLKTEIAGFNDELMKLAGFKKGLDSERAKFFEKIEILDQELKAVSSKESKIEEDKKLIEEQEKAAKDFGERRRLEKERWNTEEERRKIESRRWSLEEEKRRIKNQEKSLEVKIDSFLDKENNISKRIEEINSVLNPVSSKPSIEVEVKTVSEPLETQIKKETVLESKPVILKVEGEFVKKDLLEKKPVAPEIPVLEKDNRIEEARKRVASLKGQKETLPVEKLMAKLERRIPINETEELQKAPHVKLTKKEIPIISALPKKPSAGGKFGVRIFIFSLVLILLIIVATFWYWYLVVRKQPAAAPSQTEKEVQEQPEAPKELPPEVLAMPPLFPVDDNVVLEASSSQEMRSVLLRVIQEDFALDKFKRIIIKNPSENKTLGLRDIFERLGIVLSEDFYSKIGDKFTLFVYSQANGNRIGFVTEIKDIITFEEASLKRDFNPLLALVGGEGPALIPYFRDASQVKGYQGPNFRYQTLSKEDLGICYITYGKYYIFTSSWKSMTSVLTRLPVPEAE